MYYATITELINSINKEDISYRNLHTSMYVKTNDEIVKTPYKSIVREYMSFFEPCVVQSSMSTQDMSTYRFKPKKLSYDLYGTTELWSAILELNHMTSIIEFNNIEHIKLFEPNQFKKLLNEALILEGILK